MEIEKKRPRHLLQKVICAFFCVCICVCSWIGEFLVILSDDLWALMLMQPKRRRPHRLRDGTGE